MEFWAFENADDDTKIFFGVLLIASFVFMIGFQIYFYFKDRNNHDRKNKT